ncbi:hypothetical protein LZ023_39610 (plasmid) [Pseudomonas silvicola]|nr:hypothetical protein LZ023_39610 [Pseudomonas silvicola]
MKGLPETWWNDGRICGNCIFAHPRHPHVELIYLWQSGIKQSRFYAVRVWGARRKPLVMLLIIDTIVVVALICILSARIQML